MENENKSKKSLSRRKFLGSTATVAALSMMPINLFSKNSALVKDQTGAAPNSKFLVAFRLVLLPIAGVISREGLKI